MLFVGPWESASLACLHILERAETYASWAVLPTPSISARRFPVLSSCSAIVSAILPRLPITLLRCFCATLRKSLLFPPAYSMAMLNLFTALDVSGQVWNTLTSK